jgi:hypothetical protein
MKRRAWRRAWIVPLAVAAAAGFVEIVAAFRVRHLRAERAYLGDKRYTEIRGQGDPVVFLAGLPRAPAGSWRPCGETVTAWSLDGRTLTTSVACHWRKSAGQNASGR